MRSRLAWFRFYTGEYLLDPVLRNRELRLLYLDLKCLMARGIPTGYLSDLPGWVDTPSETPSETEQETQQGNAIETRFSNVSRPFHESVSERVSERSKWRSKSVSSPVSLIQLVLFPGLDLEYLLLHTGLTEQSFRDALEVLLERQLFSLTQRGVVYDSSIASRKSNKSTERVRRYRAAKKQAGAPIPNAGQAIDATATVPETATETPQETPPETPSETRFISVSPGGVSPDVSESVPNALQNQSITEETPPLTPPPVPGGGEPVAAAPPAKKPAAATPRDDEVAKLARVIAGKGSPQ